MTMHIHLKPFSVSLSERMRTFSASSVASCIGINPYEEPCDAFEAAWMKEDRQGYYRAVNSHRPSTSLAKRRKLVKDALSSPEGAAIRAIQNDPNRTTAEKVSAIASVDSATLDSESHALLVKFTKSSVSTAHGVRNEDSALEMYSEETGQPVKAHRCVAARGNGAVAIKGRVDGIVPLDGDDFKIVEIKNRARKLFNTVRDYEHCQAQMYLYIHNRNTCDLVERFGTEIRVYPIARDDAFIDDALRRLARFSELLDATMEAPGQYMQSDDKSAYIRDRL